VNLELPENRHFVKDYQLFTKSLVLVRFDKGRQAEYKGPRAPANSRGGA